MTALSQMEAERAFAQAARGRRFASLMGRLRGGKGQCARLAVHDERAPRALAMGARRGIRDIPLDAIAATVEPGKAAHFDRGFRPAPPTRRRWERVWLAEHRGAVLPPISVVQVGDTYAIRDGHHRVSVAKARGAVTITAIVD